MPTRGRRTESWEDGKSGPLSCGNLTDSGTESTNMSHEDTKAETGGKGEVTLKASPLASTAEGFPVLGRPASVSFLALQVHETSGSSPYISLFIWFLVCHIFSLFHCLDQSNLLLTYTLKSRIAFAVALRWWLSPWATSPSSSQVKIHSEGGQKPNSSFCWKGFDFPKWYWTQF